MKNILLISFGFLLTFSGNLLFAQNKHFTQNGTITFEKNVNMFAAFQKLINKDNESYLQSAFESYKRTQKQFRVLKSTLTFTNNKTLFTPIEPETGTGGFLSEGPLSNQVNTIFTDFNTNTETVQKNVFGDVLLVKDSTKNIKWKITGETRDIAGYTCRRANGLILDSVYVVAFYTDEIAVSGGPESFSGLPGMILGVALPHENVTWFATKVVDIPIEDKTMAAPKKGKPVNNKELHDKLESVMKNWSTQGSLYLKAFLL